MNNTPMKTTIITLILGAALAIGATAEMENWTNKDGDSTKMKLLHVDREGETASAKFELEGGGIVTLDSATLNEESAERVLKWKPTAGTEGYFDHMFDDALVILEEDGFTKHAPETKPEKYYVFYYTASWCPPCRTFTPTLVEFYKAQKNANFELILVSSDRKEEAMLEYAKKAEMPWPQVDFAKTKNIKGMLAHGVRGIPSLIVCDAQGNNLGNFRSNLEGLADLIK